jgi:hypothetical protein
VRWLLLFALALPLLAACSDEDQPPPVGTPGITEGTFDATPTTGEGPGTAQQTQPTESPPSPTPIPLYIGDPTDPQPPPRSTSPATRYFTETAHYVRGEFLDLFKELPRSADLLGLPLTEEFPQQFTDGSILRVQYFERGRMEYHPQLPAGKRVQLGALVPPMLAGRNIPRLNNITNTATRVYFPETGHTLSSGFLNFWRANGGLPVFGLPLTEELGEDGVTVQYFERARFEYHSKLEGTPYAVQLSPVGYMALKGQGFKLPLGTLVRFNPPVLREGHTISVEIEVPAGITVTGDYQGRPLLFVHNREAGRAWSLVGAVSFGDLGPRPINFNLRDARGNGRLVTRVLDVQRHPFPVEVLNFSDQTAQLLDPNLTQKERETLNRIFAGRSPEQLWKEPFRMPIDGRIRVTSEFATRRCYQCAAGAAPTTYHGGLDMGVAEGTRVRAPADGVVVLAEKLAVRGNTIIIDHGLGVFSLLAHNLRLDAEVGQAVKRGDVVSLSGNTGLSNGPHLHWEVHVNGPAVDPMEWVNRMMP